ncbi:MAG: 2,5-diamino-6-(ribosylamino)-4(3H)-pyrimidinone 5'-phosphate reductase [Candidatus Altiarchaeota archaeon]
MKKHIRIILNAAMSLDGKIGKSGERIRLSNDLDKKRVHEMRSDVDAIMVGINTILNDNPKLTAHYSEKKKNPIRIVVDSDARTPLNANVMNISEARTIIAVSQKASDVRLRDLQKNGAEVIKAGISEVDLNLLIDKLKRQGIKKILLEGGGILNHAMLSLGLVDEIYITIAPRILGSGINLINGSLEKEILLKLEGIIQLNDQVVFHYIVDKK